jgi:eukaryotic-like serine/threonine-protein kinase
MRCPICKLDVQHDALYCGHCGRRTRRRHDSRNGTVIDDAYRIDAMIARGGFGVVYRATTLRTGLAVALKILHADLAADESVRARFARESRALAKLRSPHTVLTLDRGETHDGTLYIVMELLDGETLEQRLARSGKLPWRSALEVLRAVCRSVAEAHACRIVHRDLKPANIHLGANDFVKVLDFGVAKLMPWSGIDSAELTMTGEAIGTLEYMAPELLLGAACDPRSDIYSLGVVAYEVLTGRLPFPGCPSGTALVAAALTQPLDPVSLSSLVPADVDRLVARCLDPDPTRRYASIIEVASAIDRVLHSPSPVLAMPLQWKRL